ncbi:hypothetical protein SPRG_16939 [Saprolegnia parasitica CBS 223.65]|uniref:Tyrosinase copper-binding domain-containing protein n=1 Tax=Saprolegnia parasitica (strain CBS 223.65) TaxID=695850 RepID=A0A067BLT8_SAPPC|nr:hypothetical protein SPRG_16939 [Saprolegnia parasitica CBS 223.65]KDO17665.1 hypothetical protein SPRG_16939 [Saprolegnia parasitica CBS 223.65]|eukprot:XP_012211625.1 hypothetical protein SPRG_16939 [Saprolegnia parasitica CBS 223.65]
MRASYLLTILLMVAAVAWAETTQTTSPPRVRRAWSQYSRIEKDTYISAVALAMQKGLHHRFMEVHMEPSSEREAHSCLFFYWHRAYLLAYENMLRSLGPQYSGITLPFWDYATIGANFIAGSCKNMLSCGSLLQDFGGSLPRGPAGIMTYKVNGEVIQSDNCIKSNLTSGFCQSTSAFINKSCLGCMPRNDWSRVAVPPDVNVLSVYNNILGTVAPTLAGVTSGVQYGTHNMVHAVLNAVMGTFASPADPVFYAHHAMADALHTIYYNCVVASKPPINKGADARTWSSCRNLMGRGNSGTQPASVWLSSHPLNPYFAGIPKLYTGYTDTTKIGANSYTYNFTGTMLDKINKQCTQFQPSVTSFLYQPNEAPTSTEVSTEISWLQDATRLAAQFYTDPKDVNLQVQMMLCVYYNECLGGVFDYSDEFKTSFHATVKPPCKSIIDDLARGDVVIGVEGWESLLLKRYSCNSPSMMF